MRELVKLVCTECGDENYHTTKNKKIHCLKYEHDVDTLNDVF